MQVQKQTSTDFKSISRVFHSLGTEEDELLLVDTLFYLVNDLEKVIPSTTQDIAGFSNVREQNQMLSKEDLSKYPTKFFSPLLHIMNQNENIYVSSSSSHRDTDKSKKRPLLPRLWFLSPLPSTHWRFISLNGKALSSLSTTKIGTANGYHHNLNFFFNHFDFRKIGFTR